MLPRVDNEGRIYVTPSGTPVCWNAGLGYTADGRLCVSSILAPTDMYVNGWRRDSVGRLVVGAQVATPTFNAGWPVNPDGSVARQIDQTPASTDPFVAGVRIGPLGGVYMTTAAFPNETGFSNGFNLGYK